MDTTTVTRPAYEYGVSGAKSGHTFAMIGDKPHEKTAEFNTFVAKLSAVAAEQRERIRKTDPELFKQLEAHRQTFVAGATKATQSPANALPLADGGVDTPEPPKVGTTIAADTYDTLKLPEQTGRRAGLRLRYKNMADFNTPRPTDWLIEDVFERDAVASIFAPSGKGKSFVAFDIGLSIATGRDWFGHKVKKGTVVHIANGEGEAGSFKRITAWTQRHGGAEDVKQNFIPLDQTCMFPNGSLDSLIADINDLGDVRMLIIDTLQQSFVGNPDATSDMLAYTQAIKRIKTECKGIVVLIIHHTGLKNTERAAGSSALKNSLDAEYRLSGEGGHLIFEATKMKESELPKPITMQIKSERLLGWDNEDGKATWSATVHEYLGLLTVGESKVNPQQQIALSVLERMLEVEGATTTVKQWYEAYKSRNGVPKYIAVRLSKFEEKVSVPLVAAGFIKIDESGFVNETVMCKSLFID